MRIFLACGVDWVAADRLHAALEPLRRVHAGPAFNWVPPVNYHVTLRFFGELNERDVERAAHLVEPIAMAAAPFEARAVAARPLPNARRPNVIALPMDSSGRIEALAALFRQAFEDDFGLPDKPFKAHLTVIRCRRGARFIGHAIDFAFPLAFDRVALFESSAGNGAPRYAPLRTFVFGA